MCPKPKLQGSHIAPIFDFPENITLLWLAQGHTNL